MLGSCQQMHLTALLGNNAVDGWPTCEWTGPDPCQGTLAEVGYLPTGSCWCPVVDPSHWEQIQVLEISIPVGSNNSQLPKGDTPWWVCMLS